MRVSARCDYACRALLELAMHWPSKAPLHIEVISKRQRIPIKYLIQILIQLKRMGIVESSRGKLGGYNLAVAPGKVKLGELVREIGGPLLPVANGAVNKKTVFGEIWQNAENAMAKVLDDITFEDIVNRARTKEGAISYQI